MDDRKFDQKTAELWIDTVEAPNSPRENDVYPKIRDWINRVNASRILDIGSGQGICSEKIELDGRHYTGVEPSAFLVERAKELYSSQRRRFVIGSAYDLPFQNGSFDAAFSVAVWHLLGDLEKASTELARVLKPKGHFLIITANPSGYELWKNQYVRGNQKGNRFEGVGQDLSRDVLYFYDLEEITGALEEAGLEVQGTETFRGSEKFKGLNLFVSIEGQKVR